MFKCQDLYDHIHALQPQVLVSYKQGLIGTEDFMAPERRWKEKTTKPLEICDTLQPHQWFYNKSLDGKHTIFGQVVEGMDAARRLTVRDPATNPVDLPPADRILSVTITEE